MARGPAAGSRAQSAPPADLRLFRLRAPGPKRGRRALPATLSARLGDADVLVLSRFAYLRRRGSEMVLESPRAGALFKICDPKSAAFLAMLSAPRRIKELRRQVGFPGLELLALLMDCQILFKGDP